MKVGLNPGGTTLSDRVAGDDHAMRSNEFIDEREFRMTPNAVGVYLLVAQEGPPCSEVKCSRQVLFIA
jgi:hypothetical protein